MVGDPAVPVGQDDDGNETKKFDDIPPRTKEFLSNLRDDEIDTLNDGIRLVGAIRTVGTFAKWLIVGMLGIFAGIVVLGVSVTKIAAWFRGQRGRRMEECGGTTAPAGLGRRYRCKVHPGTVILPIKTRRASCQESLQISGHCRRKQRTRAAAPYEWCPDAIDCSSSSICLSVVSARRANASCLNLFVANRLINRHSSASFRRRSIQAFVSFMLRSPLVIERTSISDALLDVR